MWSQQSPLYAQSLGSKTWCPSLPSHHKKKKKKKKKKKNQEIFLDEKIFWCYNIKIDFIK